MHGPAAHDVDVALALAVWTWTWTVVGLPGQALSAAGAVRVYDEHPTGYLPGEGAAWSC